MAKTWVEQAEVFEAEIYNDIIEHTIPRIAEQAMDVIIEAWNDGQGYESSGELVEWDQEKLKEMTSEQLWNIFAEWSEISWDRMADRSYNLDANSVEIQA